MSTPIDSPKRSRSKSSSGHARQVGELARHVYALARRNGPRGLDGGVERAVVDRLDPQPDRAVGQEDLLSLRDCARQARPRDRHPPGVALFLAAAVERDLRAVGQVGDPVAQRADPHLRAGQVLEHRDLAADAARGVADPLDRLRVLVARAVREVEPRDVEPGLDHPHEHVRLARGRSDGGDDLRSAQLAADVTRVSGGADGACA